MRIEVFPDADTVASQAAHRVAAEARAACAARGQFTLAVSGGQTPWQMLRALAAEDVPWDRLHVFQVDERVAPAGHAERNLTHLAAALLADAPLRPEQIHAMPVEQANLEAAAADYARTLAQIAGSPPVLDLVHLGLGADGHTASLVPGDPVLNIVDADVALTGEYQGRRRVTLTYSILNRSRRILWLATGATKTAMLKRLLAADATIPAGRVARSQAMILADLAAAGDIPATCNLKPNPMTTSSLLTPIAQQALSYVKEGDIVGLGTGRAATAFIEALAASGRKVIGIATSEVSAESARRLGIRLSSLDECPELAVTVDGADEIDPLGNAIKGYGGALVREKIVAAASRKLVLLVGDEKLVPVLGSRGKLPVEVLPFGRAATARHLQALGLSSQPRESGGKLLVSDNGNHILDCQTGPIERPAELEASILAIPGVVGTGLFLGMADVVLVQRGEQVEVREPKKTR